MIYIKRVESRLNVYHFLKKEGQNQFDLLNSLDQDLALHPELQNIYDDVSKDVLYFETCLRKIWISYNDLQSLFSQTPKSNAFSKLDILKDETAYEFLLEVFCGLKSPLIGETEVFGQFKNQVLKTLDPKTALSKVIHSLMADTKSIRSRHLKNLGSSSYGSLARKHLTGIKSLDILGAGQFVQSLKPWIEKLDIHTNVYTRSPKKYASTFEASKWSLKPTVEYTPLLATAPKALLICAPMDMKSFDLSVYDLVIDFRDSTSLNQFEHRNLKVLSEVFAEIEKDNLLAHEKKKEALQAIKKAGLSYMSTMNHRPFGWDDLSA